jgi:hypothetical protein
MGTGVERPVLQDDGVVNMIDAEQPKPFFAGRANLWVFWIEARIRKIVRYVRPQNVLLFLDAFT